MPIEQSIWKIGDTVERVDDSELSTELELEDVLQKNIEIISSNWLVIGRQVLTDFGGYVDLLAIDNNGSIIVIELKKSKTDREVVAQAIDYASWIAELQSQDIAEIYQAFSKKYLNKEASLDQAFNQKFKATLKDDTVNASHQMVIVATQLDSRTERIVNYLNKSDIPMNVVFFKVVKDGAQKYISRAWLIDPQETSDKAISQKQPKEPWNQEYYMSFGHDESRDWNDARKYGFICAGGGTWYSRTLNQLSIGDRVWVNIPGTGYVGVGTVSDTARKADEVTFEVDGKTQTIYELSKTAHYHKDQLDDDDNAEYIVKVEWIHTVPLTDVVSEVGFFGNQHIICKPRVQKWSHTVKRLKEIWGLQKI